MIRKIQTIVPNLEGATASVTTRASVATATSRIADGDRERTEVAREMSVARMASVKAAGVIARAIDKTTEDGIVTKPRRNPSGSMSR